MDRRAYRRDHPSAITLATRGLVVAVVAPLLARLDLARLQRVLEPRRVGDPGADVQATAGRVGHLVDRVTARAGVLVRPGCLVRGITRYTVLRRAGVDVALCFGMGHPKGQLEGHCWLVLGSEVLFEPDGFEAGAAAAAPTFTEVVRVSRSGLHR